MPIAAGMVPSVPAFSPSERRALELYDRLRELQLQLALLRTRQQHVPDSPPKTATLTLGGLQSRLLDTKTALALRNEVLESVLIIEPTLKAVHHATHASPVERDILPHIQHCELASAAEAKQNHAVRELNESLGGLELKSRRVGHRNSALAAELLQLTTESSRNHGTEASHENHFAGEILALEQEIETSRKKWKFMKGAASAIVAGSGIDWVRDERLKGIVLDSADEEAVVKI